MKHQTEAFSNRAVRSDDFLFEFSLVRNRALRYKTRRESFLRFIYASLPPERSRKPDTSSWERFAMEFAYQILISRIIRNQINRKLYQHRLLHH